MADQLSIDSSAAIKLGMSYGQYMAMKYNGVAKAAPKPEPVAEQQGKICPVCGKRFTGYRASQKYCSENCRYIASYKPVPVTERECLFCGKVFMQTDARQKTCSAECQEQRHRQQVMGNYRRKRENNG